MTPMLAYPIGLAFAVFGGHLAIKLILDAVHARLGTTRAESWLPAIVGGLERALFAASWQLGKVEFIAVWFAMKAGWSWPWKQQAADDPLAQRLSQYTFLLGSGLSVAFGSVGGELSLGLSGSWLPEVPLTHCIVLLAGSALLAFTIRRPRRG